MTLPSTRASARASSRSALLSQRSRVPARFERAKRYEALLAPGVFMSASDTASRSTVSGTGR